jgi:phosphonoacetate hydrolase
MIEVNGRSYRAPEEPTVVICLDGCDPAYLAQGLPDGVFPTIGSFRESGYFGQADAVLPTFTNLPYTGSRATTIWTVKRVGKS